MGLCDFVLGSQECSRKGPKVSATCSKFFKAMLFIPFHIFISIKILFSHQLVCY